MLCQSFSSHPADLYQGPCGQHVFCKNHKKTSLKSHFPQISHYIRGFGVFFATACLSCSVISCQSPSVPTAPHPPERLPSWKRKTQTMSPMFCTLLTFFPALLASCISRSQSGNSCKNKTTFAWVETSFCVSTNHAAMPSFQSCTQTPLLTRACVHVLSCTWRDFIHQRSARTADWIHAHERQNLGWMHVRHSVLGQLGCLPPRHLPPDIRVPRNSTNP